MVRQPPYANLQRCLPVKKNENRLSFDRIIAMSLWLHFWQTLYSPVCDNPVQSLGRPLRGTLMWEILAYLAYHVRSHFQDHRRVRVFHCAPPDALQHVHSTYTELK